MDELEKEYVMQLTKYGNVYAYESKQEIVRCKDCKHYEMPRFGELGYCNQNRMVAKTIWFCADGEPKDA